MGSDTEDGDAPATPAGRPRDKDATMAAILVAASTLLADEGFQNFGVNAVARRAGCDKQLIYRYFGGLDGVIDAIGEDLAESIAAKLAPRGAVAEPATYLDLVGELAVSFLRMLRDDRLMQKIVAWEMVGAHPRVRRLSETRSRALMAWMAKRRGSLTPPPGLDVFVINALLIGAIQQLVLAGTATGRFAGLALETDEDWRRVETTLVALVRSLDRSATAE